MNKPRGTRVNRVNRVNRGTGVNGLLSRATDIVTGPTGPAGPTGPIGPTGETSGVPQIIKFISQQAVDDAGGFFLLDQQGFYCLQENIVGVLVVAVNHVCLDLCCFTLSAGGLPNAIILNSVDDVQVYGGSISDTTSAGILVEKCNSIALEDLRMFDHKLDMIRIVRVSGIAITEVSFDSNNNGERALHFDQCDSVTIDLCSVSGFLSTRGALIELVECDTVSVQNIDIHGNTKSLHSQNSVLDVSASFMHSSNSTGVYMQYVKFNNNTVANKNQGNRYFNALAFVNCVSSSLYHLETGSNKNTNGAAENAIAIDNLIFIANCSDFITIDCQLNENRVEAATTGFYGVHVLDSNNITFYGCQANSNYVKSLIYNPSSSSGVAGFFMEGIQSLATENNVIGNCQANNNRVDDGGIRIPGGLVARLFGVIIEGSVSIDICQANNNSMGTNGVGQRVGGFLGIGSTNLSITNAMANNNTGGEISCGFQLRADGELAQSNARIVDCTANTNGGYGIILGDPVLNDNELIENTFLGSCICNKNGNDVTEAAGILVINNVNNVSIQNCQVNDTYSFGNIANGIRVKSARNVTISDTIVNTTSSPVSGHGILFENVKNSKVSDSQMTHNCSSGFELIGCDNNSISVMKCSANCNEKGYSVNSSGCLTNGLFKENVSMNNTTIGFEHGPQSFATGYVSNYAQGNAQDYLINGGVIGLHTLGFNDGQTEAVTGNATVSHWTNISAA